MFCLLFPRKKAAFHTNWRAEAQTLRELLESVCWYGLVFNLTGLSCYVRLCLWGTGSVHGLEQTKSETKTCVLTQGSESSFAYLSRFKQWLPLPIYKSLARERNAMMFSRKPFLGSKWAMRNFFLSYPYLFSSSKLNFLGIALTRKVLANAICFNEKKKLFLLANKVLFC